MEKTKQAVLQIDVAVYSTLVCACQHTGAEETCLSVLGVTLLPGGTNTELLSAFRMVRVPLTLPQYLVGRLENLYIDSDSGSSLWAASKSGTDEGNARVPIVSTSAAYQAGTDLSSLSVPTTPLVQDLPSAVSTIASSI